MPETFKPENLEKDQVRWIVGKLFQSARVVPTEKAQDEIVELLRNTRETSPELLADVFEMLELRAGVSLDDAAQEIIKKGSERFVSEDLDRAADKRAA